MVLETNETDIYDHGARLMDPALGRFLGVDPLVEQEGVQHSPYAFCMNDPVNRVDVDGRRTRERADHGWWDHTRITKRGAYYSYTGAGIDGYYSRRRKPDIVAQAMFVRMGFQPETATLIATAWESGKGIYTNNLYFAYDAYIGWSLSKSKDKNTSGSIYVIRKYFKDISPKIYANYSSREVDHNVAIAEGAVTLNQVYMNDDMNIGPLNGMMDIIATTIAKQYGIPFRFKSLVLSYKRPDFNHIMATIHGRTQDGAGLEIGVNEITRGLSPHLQYVANFASILYHESLHEANGPIYDEVANLKAHIVIYELQKTHSSYQYISDSYKQNIDSIMKKYQEKLFKLMNNNR